MNFSGNKCSPSFRSPAAQQQQSRQLSRLNVQENLEHRQKRAEARNYLKWGFINIILLTLICVDLWQTCLSMRSTLWYQVEFSVAVCISLSVAACAGKYFWWLCIDNTPLCVTEVQRCLLDEGNDNTFQCIKNLSKPRSCEPEYDDVTGPIINWHSSFEDSRWNSQSTRRSVSPMRSPVQQRKKQQQQFNQSHNRSISNQSHNRSISNQSHNRSMGNQSLNRSMGNQSYNRSMVGNNSLNVSNDSVYMSPYAEVCREDFPTDVRKLPALMRRAELERERSYAEMADTSTMQSIGATNSFWNYCNNAAFMLKRTIYQLAPAPVPSTENAPSSIEDFGIVQFKDGNSEVIKRISTVKLSQYLSNLRYWISTTILQRLVKQIDNMDEIFRQRGLSDFKIGAVGLERLRKMAENQQFVQSCAPMLPLLFPFLDTFTNQEYLVQRIRDLAEGSCMGDYRWNSGDSYKGKVWGTHLPTDAAIVFHLFCVYFDSQLMPLPQGGGRPFYSRYVLIREEKRSTKEIINAVNNKAHCAILVTNIQLKPKFNFISEKELHNCANDRNNLFYVIIQFLIYMRSHQESMLEGVNLGKSGINIMCVIGD
ncbi:PREDICTED: transmembrane protein 209 [Drosophila arizonae]|uniref:Transmembrane protein 209 n=1 Tax=Drosophila arizonae TaxID=7263 RepID=A0ABM1PAZ7_DROAR|nr:PREDICTED: transmembrane protein 209 [Drosophila arizonae]